MNICSLIGRNAKLCRQVFVLAQHFTRTESVVPIGFSAFNRFAHSSSLYKMVKKRTLEARTKQQPSKYPNNQPCLSSKSAGSETTTYSAPVTYNVAPATSPARAEPTPAPLPKSPPQRINQPTKSYSSTPQSSPPSTFQKMQQSSQASNPKVEVERSETCKNTNVLKADFTVTSEKPSTPTGGSDGGAGGGKDCDPNKSAPPTDDSEKNKKMLMALLAALGSGGLFLYFLLRSTDKSKECRPAPGAAGGAVSVAPVGRPIPASSSLLPKHVPYLLIGGGTASFSAFRAIKSNDAKAKVLMITNELRKPYMRPPLSKELWYSSAKGDVAKDYRFKQWTGTERSLYFEPDEFFVDPQKLAESVNGGIAVAQGYAVTKIDPANHIVTLNDGCEIGYDECLIATGCSPKGLHVFDNAPLGVKDRVMYYRTPEDFERLKRYADENKSITIIGNGFIASELACSLATYAKDRKIKIYQVFPEAGNMSKVLPDYLSKWTTLKMETLGVCVVPHATITEAKRDESMLKLELNNGSTILTGVAVVCVGCEANTALANASGLEVDRKLGGFVVNAELEARRNLFVAGDASCFYDPLSGRRRVEHHDHSVVSGRLAGENMVGKKKAYAHQSMFWSDLGPEIGYEGIGLVDASLETVGVFDVPSKADRTTDNLTESRVEQLETLTTPAGGKDRPDDACHSDYHYGRGVIFYLKDEKIVGILLWNLFNRIALARTLISQDKKYEDLNEVAKLFEIHA